MSANTSETMKLEILSPEKILYRGDATSVGLPGKCGYMTVLPGHAAMIAELDAGLLTYLKPQEGEQKYFVGGGFVEVRDNQVRVLVDVIEKISEIDVERAKKSLQRAQERLSGKAQSGNMIDYERAGAAFKRAETRLNAATSAGR